MPEGPEVESVRRTLAPHLDGARLQSPWVSKFKLRTPVTQKELIFLDKKKVQNVGRKGKVLWVLLSPGSNDDVKRDEKRNGESQEESFSGIFIRLGMSGRVLLVDKDAPKEKHTHVVIDVVVKGKRKAGTQLRYVDPRRFGEVVPFRSREEWQAALDRLGPCPNSFDDDDRAFLKKKLQRTTRSIKEALLDQSVVCGVGNIYASEACFIAKLSPLLSGASLSNAQAKRLVDATEQCMNEAVAHGGTSFSDYVDAEGNQGRHQNYLLVFLREGEACKRCAKKKCVAPVVKRITQGGRSTFYCEKCQK
ncbi:MAG: bifunctional DNA-formamidopyrimidine glycosylase/DNA-(apurinic or apyrimidinic site) lyase [Deltaproteobacteria bacterium]|nr:bifunctional DNA-formamidopyrimidine glycosylase/DNA-(apurinic or apyrimidinic site) lyase [Deltaproteobacteria bacterium]